MTLDPTPHDHDGGLAVDLLRLQGQMGRRQWLRGLLAGAAPLALWGCGGGGDAAGDTGSAGTTGSTAGSATGSTSGSTTSGSTTCSAIAEETAGPYPGDGSNASGGVTANALALTGIVRADIRSSIAGASGTASGVPLTVVLDLVNTNASCADLSGWAVYLWHCDALGRYSMYSSGVTAENYLRGVQSSGSDGLVTFQTIVPGCYAGRWPHIHFEIYRSSGTATSWTNKLRTSQLALPESVCRTVYGSASGYTGSLTNLNGVSLTSDNVFSDGVTTQMATVTGSVAAGYVATLQVGVPA
jgi:protocatechuate 3,4-dioxygenase beta subunit